MCGSCGTHAIDPGGGVAESSAGARQLQALLAEISGEAMSDFAEEFQPEQFSHATRKKDTFVRLEDVAARLSKPVKKTNIVMAVLDGDVLRKPKAGETVHDYVAVKWLQDKHPEAFGLEAIKSCRPDKAEAKERSKYEVERATKCALQKHLLQKSLLPAIRERVRAVSESTNRAGLMLLDIIMRSLDRCSAFPKLDQTFFRHLLLGDMSDPFVAESFAEAFSTFPRTTRFAGDGQPYSSAARDMMTNFYNSIVFAFEPRQKRYIKLWCSQDPAARGEAWPIIKAINNWGTMETLTAEGERFVAAERAHLDNPSSITSSWLKGNVETVIKTYRRWLQYFEENDAKLFCLTPIWSIKSHFVEFDTDAMHGLMHAEGLYKGNLASFRSDPQHIEEQFLSVFSTKGLASKEWKFSMNVQTDGVALCVHFKRQKSDDEIANMKIKAAERAKNNVVAAEKKAARERSPERLQREFEEAKALKKLAAEKKKEAKKEEAKKLRAAKREAKKNGVPEEPKADKPKDEAPEAAPRPVLQDGDLSQDPGNNPNITYTVHMVNGKMIKRRMTIGRYYTEGGVKRLQHRTSVWQKNVQAEHDILDEVSLKTSSHAHVRAHVRRYATVHLAIWNEKTKSRWARGRFDTYIRKPKALDTFFKQIKKDGPVLRSFYGGASCSSSIAGTKPAPKSQCLQRAKHAFPGTEMVDEYLTTQLCWKCLERTQQVAYVEGGRTKTVRGLVYCDSSTCGCFRDRDFQGAMNIMACGIGPRPAELARTEGHVRRTDKRFIPAPMKKQCALRRNYTLLCIRLAADLSQT